MGIRNAIGDIRIMNQLFTTADREASALGDEQTGAEHLLIAALRLDDSAAGLGITPDSVRSAITAVHTAALGAVRIDPPEPTTSSGEPGVQRFDRSNASLREVFQRSRILSKGGPIRAISIVIAAAERQHGTVARVFDTLGIDRAALIAGDR